MALSLAEGCIENKKLEIVASASCAKSKVKDIHMNYSPDFLAAMQ